MSIRSCILAVLLTVVCYGSQARIPDAVEKASKATHAIQFKTIVQGAGCSATSIAPQALLTASHCELGTDKFTIDGRISAKVIRILRDGLDHSIILYDGPAMADFVALKSVMVHQGDDIFVFGNPGELHNIFRHGYFAGFDRPSMQDSIEAMFGDGGSPVRAIYDFNGYHGDSGAAVFNEDGQIIGVVSVGIIQKEDEKSEWAQCLMGGWAPDFTKEQIQTAESFFQVQKPDLKIPEFSLFPRGPKK